MDNIMIYSINIWKIEKEYKNNLLEEDIVYDMMIGQYEIYPEAYPIIKSISKNIYDKLINKEYILEERLDLEELFLIKDQNGNYISLIAASGTFFSNIIFTFGDSSFLISIVSV